MRTQPRSRHELAPCTNLLDWGKSIRRHTWQRTRFPGVHRHRRHVVYTCLNRASLEGGGYLVDECTGICSSRGHVRRVPCDWVRCDVVWHLGYGGGTLAAENPAENVDDFESALPEGQTDNGDGSKESPHDRADDPEPEETQRPGNERQRNARHNDHHQGCEGQTNNTDPASVHLQFDVSFVDAGVVVLNQRDVACVGPVTVVRSDERNDGANQTATENGNQISDEHGVVVTGGCQCHFVVTNSSRNQPCSDCPCLSNESTNNGSEGGSSGPKENVAARNDRTSDDNTHSQVYPSQTDGRPLEQGRDASHDATEDNDGDLTNDQQLPAIGVGVEVHPVHVVRNQR
mmetsp:Transcript_128817/g.222566  ORF Transcript_128817/g.222566 Transcript_128817/m.222566 type:complete len:345 (-) Transcript_128817:1329-2363(-)